MHFEVHNLQSVAGNLRTDDCKLPTIESAIFYAIKV